MVPLAQRVSLALQQCTDVEVLAAGLSALHALAGCMTAAAMSAQSDSAAG